MKDESSVGYIIYRPNEFLNWPINSGYSQKISTCVQGRPPTSTWLIVTHTRIARMQLYKKGLYSAVSRMWLAFAHIATSKLLTHPHSESLSQHAPKYRQFFFWNAICSYINFLDHSGHKEYKTLKHQVSQQYYNFPLFTFQGIGSILRNTQPWTMLWLGLSHAIGCLQCYLRQTG